MEAFKNITKSLNNINEFDEQENVPVNLDLVCTPSPKKSPIKKQGTAISGIDYEEDLLVNALDEKDARTKDPEPKTKSPPKLRTPKPQPQTISSDGTRMMTINMAPGKDPSVVGGPGFRQYSPARSSPVQPSPVPVQYSPPQYNPVQSHNYAQNNNTARNLFNASLSRSQGSVDETPGFGFDAQSVNASARDYNDNDDNDDDDDDEDEIPTYEQIQNRKDNGLARLKRLSDQGYRGAKRLSNTSTLQEIESQVKKLQAQKELDNSIKTQQKYLIGAVTIIEFINESYNPFDLQLEGWSESIYEDISSYDDVFEELYEKYKNIISITPELKLLGMIAGSAAMFHFSKMMMSKARSKIPEFDDVMNANPELRRAYKETASKLFSNKDKPNKKSGGDKSGFLSKMMGVFMGGNDTMPGRTQAPPPPPPPVSQRTNNQSQNRPRPSNQSQNTKTEQSNRNRTRNEVDNNNDNDSDSDRTETRTRTRDERETKQYDTSRKPMEPPHDVNGLLSSLITGKGEETNSDIDELDLSEIDNFSDLSST